MYVHDLLVVYNHSKHVYIASHASRYVNLAHLTYTLLCAKVTVTTVGLCC